MARMSAYDDAHDVTYYVVERSDGKSDGRKEFYSYSQAEAYQNYLQEIEDRERSLAQNQQIIENQEKLLRAQELQRNRPNVTRQVLDPQYEEWLRYKKATDPAFIAWKAEEERKKQIRAREEKAKAFERQQQENKIYLETHLTDISYYERELDKFYAIYAQVRSLYETACKISFVGTAKVDYEIEDGYHYIVFNGGSLLNTRDYESRLSKSYVAIDTYLKSNPSYNVICTELRKASKDGLRSVFDEKIKILSSLRNNFYCFYNYFLTYTYDIVKDYDVLSSPYYCENLTFKPYGFFAKLKVKRVVNEYLSKNERNYALIKSIYQKLLSLLGPCGIRG